MLHAVSEAWLTWSKKVKARLFGLANAQEIRQVRRELERVLQQAAQEQEPGALPLIDPSTLSDADKVICDRIANETKRYNRNNVTRTQAYWESYRQHPELHWSLLAHMVSRNGGYNMTDLQGELLPRVMEKGECERFFHFLERPNYLIFGDAYPQLRLYAASKERGRPLFHLLPFFGVSRFMRVIWERFWETGDSQLLTLALVVNEQNVIEKRVVQHKHYAAVVESFEFQAQTLLNLTQVVFPFRDVTKTPDPQLAGVIVDSFTSLSERIDTGRRLYAILFDRQEVHRGVLQWAEQTPHTGSRSDYWPHLYTPEHPSPPKTAAANKPGPYTPRVHKLALKQGASPLYSPRLQDAWPDVEKPEAPERYDWCVSAEAAEELYPAPASRHYNITALYGQTLMLIERMAAVETWKDKRT
ncbi:MAG TPA: DUF2515 family protein [Bacilli bacterium]|nr:DUF2515 family protein [Bacilli bacterium]